MIARRIHEELRGFREFGAETRVSAILLPSGGSVPVYVNEYWTARQRQAHSLHEVSYRACFKPQLPRFFIERLTKPGDTVYDPFMGRGTTPLEAALLGRVPAGCDINPLSARLTLPRLLPPEPDAITRRLAELPHSTSEPVREDLRAFYHPEVLQALTAMRAHFLRPDADETDAWLHMVATNRLTGHSPGFFSVYSLPPNQAVSVRSQLLINQKRNQVPPPRNISAILLKKSRQLLKDLTAAERKTLAAVRERGRFATASCDDVSEIHDNSAALAVTSPPFLDEVNYQTDNWLRCWFHGLDASAIPVWQISGLNAWREKMTGALRELRRILIPGGWAAFEVGEVKGGTIRLEEAVLPAAVEAGLTPELVMINSQDFTKTSNCWGVSNRELGTNTNRIVLLRKE